MGTVLALIVVAAIAVGIYIAVTRSRAAAGGAANPRVDPLRKDSRGIDPRRLKVGDVVNHEGTDYLVRGSIRFSEDGFEWQEHLLDDASGRRWLSVEDDEDLELVVWDRLVAPDLTPGGSHLTHDGVQYTLDEHGSASYRAEGTTGTPETGRAEYYDYSGPDGRRLSFERYTGDSWEVSVGAVVNERALDIYPVDPNA